MSAPLPGDFPLRNIDEALAFVAARLAAQFAAPSARRRWSSGAAFVRWWSCSRILLAKIACGWLHEPVLISAQPDVIQMLADPLRARIIDLLADGPACVCHLVDATGAKQPTVSHHLRALRQAGLVVAEPRGRFTYYRLLPGAFAAAGQRLVDLATRAAANTNPLPRPECP